MGFNPTDIVDRVASILPRFRPIEHHSPLIGEDERIAGAGTVDRIDQHDLPRQFEEKLRDLTGAEQVLAVSSGTAALHLALMAAGVKPGHEVLVPALTYVATANAVTYVGATPNFIDGTLTISPYKLRCYLAQETKSAPDKIGRINKRTDRRIVAIIPVHLLGNPADMAEITQIAKEFGLDVIEDAAQAVGSTYKGQHCGTHGVAGILSFNTNKIITTGGGGALLTNDPILLSEAWSASTVGRIDHPWEVNADRVGWNYRMGQLNAALGLAQLKRLPNILARKAKLAREYRAVFAGCDGAEFLEPGPGSNNWLNAIWINQEWHGGRDQVLSALHKEGFKARAMFTPLHKLPMYAECPRHNLLNAELTAECLICLPSGPGLVDG